MGTTSVATMRAILQDAYGSGDVWRVGEIAVPQVTDKEVLVKVEAAPTLEQTGWARHVFFDTGDGQLFAVWDLHDDTIPDFDPAISRGLGLPTWVNHIAFAASNIDDLAARRSPVVELDRRCGCCTCLASWLDAAGGLWRTPGVGIDRLAMLLAGVTSIKEVILFPTLRPEA